jgi:YD repeat-containing protein
MMALFVWMICGQGIRAGMVADTVVEKTYLEWGHDPLYPECTILYLHSEDGRRDTVLSTCSGARSVNEYDAENRLIAVYQTQTVDPYVLRYTYEYDAEGRLSKKTDHYLQTTEEYDYSALVYTNRGYVSADSEPEFDTEGRLVRMKYNHISPPGNCFVRIAQDFDNQGDEADCYYVLKDWAEVSEEEKSRAVACETTWSYFENGYAEYRMRAVGGQDDNMFNRQKTEYRLLEQERGYSEETRVYIMFNEADSRWVLKDHSERFYYFQDTRLPEVVPLGVGDVEAGIPKVYGVAGGVEIETANAQTEEITIWSVSGLPVRRATIQASGFLPLAKGFYVVKVGKEVYKVMVR